MQNKNILIVIGLMVLIFGGVILALSLKPKPQPEQPAITQPLLKTKEEPTITPIPEIDTSDWKTYRNEEYGFEVRYPNDWDAAEFQSRRGVEIYNPQAKQIGPASIDTEGYIKIYFYQKLPTQSQAEELIRVISRRGSDIKIKDKYNGRVSRTSIITDVNFAIDNEIYSGTQYFSEGISPDQRKELERILFSILGTLRVLK